MCDFPIKRSDRFLKIHRHEGRTIFPDIFPRHWTWKTWKTQQQAEAHALFVGTKSSTKLVLQVLGKKQLLPLEIHM